MRAEIGPFRRVDRNTLATCAASSGAGFKIEGEVVVAPVAAALQPPLPRQGRLESGDADTVVGPVEAAAQAFQRQALAVEGTGHCVADAEIAGQRDFLAVVRPDLRA